MAIPTIFTRWLELLEVPHTTDYSDRRFHGLSFKSFFGLSKLMNVYGIRTKGLKLNNKEELTKLDAPFLAQSVDGPIMLVSRVDAENITYDMRGEVITVSRPEFNSRWTGAVLLAFPAGSASEPDYGRHRLTEVISSLSAYALAVAALIVFAYFFIDRGVYARWSTVLLTVFNLAGLYLSYMLLQKSLNIHTRTNDRVCGVLEKGGCDSIMASSASKLFGVFSWSEVGFGYFGVSLVTLLLFPHLWPSLAVFNACCLPYTVWSIWYQRFRAHHWCTLCVGVQSTLWLLFFCYLGGGWFGRFLPLQGDFFILLAVYVFSVLFLNMILRIFKNIPCHEATPRT